MEFKFLKGGFEMYKSEAFDQYEFSCAFSFQIKYVKWSQYIIGAAELFPGISTHSSLWIFISEDSSSAPTHWGRSGVDVGVHLSSEILQSSRGIARCWDFA